MMKDSMAGALHGDLYAFDPSKAAWSHLSPASGGVWPSPRYVMGFTAAQDGNLYLFGGWDGGG